MILGAAISVYAINAARLVVSLHSIEYHSGYFSLTTTWDNVECIEAPKVYLRLRERPPIRAFLGYIVIGQQPMRIPMPFGLLWRESELGQDIKRYAPRLW